MLVTLNSVLTAPSGIRVVNVSGMYYALLPARSNSPNCRHLPDWIDLSNNTALYATQDELEEEYGAAMAIAHSGVVIIKERAAVRIEDANTGFYRFFDYGGTNTLRDMYYVKDLDAVGQPIEFWIDLATGRVDSTVTPPNTMTHFPDAVLHLNM